MREQCGADGPYKPCCACGIPIRDPLFYGPEQSRTGKCEKVFPLPKFAKPVCQGAALLVHILAPLAHCRIPSTCSAEQRAPAIMASFRTRKKLVEPCGLFVRCSTHDSVLSE